MRISPRPGSAIQNARAWSFASFWVIFVTGYNRDRASECSFREHAITKPLKESPLRGQPPSENDSRPLCLGSGVRGRPFLRSRRFFGTGADGIRFPRFGPANWITTARAGLVALVAGRWLTAPRTPAIAVTAVSLGLLTMILDGADGWAARRTGMTSDFGARFDMEVDALLILILSILVWQFGKAGVWVILSGLLRYVFLAAGTVTPWIEQPLPPSRRRQTVCVVQVGGLLIALTPFVVPPLSTFVAASALAALVYSFSVDVLWLSHRAA